MFIPLKPPSGRYRGTVAAPKAESADEPGSRFGTLEITSRKGGKLQRPVKPEKQGADVSRKTGSHDGPERGWPREPRGSLEGSRVDTLKAVRTWGSSKEPLLMRIKRANRDHR